MLIKKYEEIESALLTGYSVFTTFTVKIQKDKYFVKAFTLHLERLESNAKILFGLDISRNEIKDEIHNFVKNKTRGEDKSKKILVRVALYPKNFSVAQPANISEVQIVVTGRKYNENKKAVSLQLHEMIRPLAHLKTSALFPSLQTRATAQKNGFDDALFFYEGNITEGPAWNIIFMKNNCVYFPDPCHKTFLEGFTQKILKAELEKNRRETADILIKTEDISVCDVLAGKFDACSIVSSGIDIVPVSSINESAFDIEKCEKFMNIYEKIEWEEVF